jgi:hypothetical protein
MKTNAISIQLGVLLLRLELKFEIQSSKWKPEEKINEIAEWGG